MKHKAAYRLFDTLPVWSLTKICRKDRRIFMEGYSSTTS